MKLLYLKDYLLSNTDEAHPVTLKEMIAHLASNDIQSERKSIYDDIEILREYGLDIIQDNGKYYVGSRPFEVPELKLLVDSVQSSKFITYKKTGELIKKIEQLSNIYDAQLLNRQVFVTNRIKSMNESIYYNVDDIHNGIVGNRKIRFHYFEYNTKKEPVFRKGGVFYVVSPYALTWDDENYYMVAFDSEAQKIKHYRVDKMKNIVITEEKRDGQDALSSIDLAVYAKKVFGMFSGNDQFVRLRMSNNLVGTIIDRFGKEVMIIPDGDDDFIVQVSVKVSPQFFAWICGFGSAAEIISPPDVVEQMRRHIKSIMDKY